MKKKTAVIFGTFAPLHQGHIDLIQRAKRQCDQVWVVVSGYEGDRGEQVGLSLQEWLDQMLAEISYDENQQELIFFVGEADYQQELSKRGFGTVLQESLVSHRL